ncbi:secretory calcium-binding phosphoprotein 8 [Trachinotus anak]|uniref:secretory calcium-binding phosphoprotein 8 n=1 Tax=Trachinotus anak TaxID=443729 RepID=UPI0039F17704
MNQSCVEVRHLSALKQRNSDHSCTESYCFIADLKEVQIRCCRKLAGGEMKLLTTALVIIYLTTTSARPFLRYWHHNANIPDSGMKHGRPIWGNRFWQYFNHRHSSSESSESSESSDSSEIRSSEESSEEVTDQTTTPVTAAATTTAVTTTAATTTAATTTPDMTTPNMTTPNMTTPDMITPDMTTPNMTTPNMTTPERGALTPEPITVETDRPNVAETTPIAMSTPGPTRCVTFDIPTPTPTTERRGDN